MLYYEHIAIKVNRQNSILTWSAINMELARIKLGLL
jgi:hypothetical protein